MEIKVDNIKHIVSGMEREEIISKKFNTVQSFIAIINSEIINSRNEKTIIDIDIENEDIVIKIIGNNLKQSMNFNRKININENILLVAMIRICNQIIITNTKDSIKTSKILDFKKINNNSFDEKSRNQLKGSNLVNSIEFRIEKKHFRGNTNYISVNSWKRQLKKKLAIIYNEIIFRGLTLQVFGERIVWEEKDGILLNTEYANIDDNVKIKIYKMKSEKKDIEVVVNGVKVENTKINDMINWNAKPFKEDGYTFKRLFISLYIDIDNIDLNELDTINNLIEQYFDNIIQKVKEYKENFQNENVNVSLEYNREDMKHILNETKAKSVGDATRIVLDKYFENIKKKNI